jgi:hypothetical protein
MKIFVRFIIYEIEKNEINIASNDINRISKLWSSLKDYFLRNLQLEKYQETLNFLQLINFLDYWLTENSISLILIDADIDNIQSQFLKALVTNNYHQKKLIFENFTQLISFKEINKIEIQNILLLPWLDTNALSSKITKLHLANAKSLDFSTKVKCLNSISRHGNGRQRLDTLSMCISSCEIELGVASIL